MFTLVYLMQGRMGYDLWFVFEQGFARILLVVEFIVRATILVYCHPGSTSIVVFESTGKDQRLRLNSNLG